MFVALMYFSRVVQRLYGVTVALSIAALDSLPAITVSVGCAVYRRNERVEELIKRADMALYDIKRSAKNGVAIR
ncbi:MAG: diguanylate cyclase [Helicobacteraceae bacterium]|nr:diguanylate cyclase [Helicobacteraceae bacterium]